MKRLRRFTLGLLLFSSSFRSSLGAVGDEHWDPAFGVTGVNQNGPAVLAVKGSELYAGGQFTSVGNVPATNVAKHNGTNWVALAGGISGHPDSHVRAIAIMGADVYVAGFFFDAGGTPVNHVAKWDGTNWSGLGSGVNSVVSALATDGTNLYAGGQFTVAGGVSANKIAKWDGLGWSPLGSGVSLIDEQGQERGAVDSLAASGVNIFVGGRFRLAGGLGSTNVAKWDGTAWAALGNGLRLQDAPSSQNGAVRALAVLSAKVFAGGDFRFAGTVAATNIAQWDGTNWLPLDGGVNDLLPVLTLTVNGPELFAGGSFRRIGGIDANRLAKWSGTVWSCVGSGINPGILSGGLASLAAGGDKLFAGGQFVLAGDKAATNIALWHIPHALNVNRTGNQLYLSWPATGTNFLLEACAQLPGMNWIEVQQPPMLFGDELVVTNDLGGGSRFYRLRRR